MMMVSLSKFGLTLGMVFWGVFHLLTWGASIVVVFIFSRDLLKHLRSTQGREDSKLGEKSYVLEMLRRWLKRTKAESTDLRDQF